MTDKPNNPAAYPSNLHDPRDAGEYDPEHGMTLRDHFAGLAVAPTIMLLVEVAPCAPNHDGLPGAVARLSYQIADAMLAERAKVQA